MSASSTHSGTIENRSSSTSSAGSTLSRRLGVLWRSRWNDGVGRGGLAGHDDVPDERLPEVLHDSDNLPRSTAGGSQSGSQANRRRWTAMDPLSTSWNPVRPG